MGFTDDVQVKVISQHLILTGYSPAILFDLSHPLPSSDCISPMADVAAGFGNIRVLF